MIYMSDIANYMQKNQRPIQSYEHRYLIQVYEKGSLEAQIEDKGVTILKIVQKENEDFEIFLGKEDEPGVINYQDKCVLGKNDTIFKIFDTFRSHRDIEKVLIALLELQA